MRNDQGTRAGSWKTLGGLNVGVIAPKDAHAQPVSLGPFKFIGNVPAIAYEV